MFKEATGREAWLLEKRGKFGASEDYRLLTDGKGQMFSKGAWTYIEEKFIELCTDLWEDPKMEFIEPLLWGNRYELPAFEHYCQVTGYYDMKYFGTDNPIFLIDRDNNQSGGSPDGVMGNGINVELGVEVKCPLKSGRHVFYSRLKNQYDLKDAMPAYYTQCQKNIYITGAKEWHWISFDDRFKESRKKMKLLQIYPDKRFQDNLQITLMQAVKERDRMIDEFLNS